MRITRFALSDDWFDLTPKPTINVTPLGESDDSFEPPPAMATVGAPASADTA